ncbi:MAG: phosphotransferase [Taibaiella sp.]|nr:phosphotransferase [Taibaiella sp.]
MTVNKSSAQVISTLEKLFEEHYGQMPEHVDALAVSGSDRRYYRIKGGKHSAIGAYNANVAENNTFFYFTNLFAKHGINVPKLYATSKDRRMYLQQDLGSTTLFDQVLKEGFTDKVHKNYQKSLEQLAKVQWIAGREADYKQCFASAQFNDKAIMSDLLYFKYYFADLQQIPYDKILLISELEQLSRELGHVQPQVLMYRDFQSRNIMLHEDKVYFIDYQGVMQGPPQYDIASLLWQARAQLPQAWREDLVNSYIACLSDLHVPRMDEIHFRRGYAQFVLVRLLQVLGAYGFRGLLQHKQHFITSIAPALKNLESFLASHPHLPAFPELRGLLERICTPEMQQRYTQPERAADAKLVVNICSFSYKNGIPKDKGSNGGGYVFDCRGLLNPGRFADYKHLTGKDEPVIQFLERDTRMPEFMDHAYSMVSLNVEDYLARGFEQLSVSFGCTGGQHRSVYAAEKMAAYLHAHYGIETSVTHLNTEKWMTIPETPNP